MACRASGHDFYFACVSVCQLSVYTHTIADVSIRIILYCADDISSETIVHYGAVMLLHLVSQYQIKFALYDRKAILKSTCAWKRTFFNYSAV